MMHCYKTGECAVLYEFRMLTYCSWTEIKSLKLSLRLLFTLAFIAVKSELNGLNNWIASDSGSVNYINGSMCDRVKGKPTSSVIVSVGSSEQLLMMVVESAVWHVVIVCCCCSISLQPVYCEQMVHIIFILHEIIQWPIWFCMETSAFVSPLIYAGLSFNFSSMCILYVNTSSCRYNFNISHWKVSTLLPLVIVSKRYG